MFNLWNSFKFELPEEYFKKYIKNKLGVKTNINLAKKSTIRIEFKFTLKKIKENCEIIIKMQLIIIDTNGL